MMFALLQDSQVPSWRFYVKSKLTVTVDYLVLSVKFVISQVLIDFQSNVLSTIAYGV